MDRLFTLIDLHKQAQQASSIAAFSHIVTNETHKLIPYDEAIFWRADAGTVDVEEVSGNASLDGNAPYAIDLKKLIERELKNKIADQPVWEVEKKHVDDLPDRKGMHAALMCFEIPGGEVIGGLWLLRTKCFEQAELQILHELAYGYANGLAVHVLREKRSWLMPIAAIRRQPVLIVATLLIVSLFPVRLSVTAPAEIVARDAVLVSIPFDGTIEEVLVSPGAAVKGGQIVARMEQTALKSKMDMAQQALTVAQAGLSRLRRDALSNPEKRMEMSALQSEIALKKIEYDYAQNLLERSAIHAPRDGIAIFSDKNSLMGKPVVTGDSLMQVASTEEKELLVRVPADAMIPLSGENDVKFHMNARPLKGYNATIRVMGYQASTDADGLLTYKIRAQITDEVNDVRIGWKGSATIKEEWTVFSYAVLRRPLASLRRMLGV